MKTRVKVKRTELIKIVDGRLRKAKAEHERAVAALPAEREQYAARVVAALAKALARAEKGVLPKQERYDSVIVPVGAYAPLAPSLSRATCDLERLLKTLKIGAEDTVTLSLADADAYFGPCELNARPSSRRGR